MCLWLRQPWPCVASWQKLTSHTLACGCCGQLEAAAYNPSENLFATIRLGVRSCIGAGSTAPSRMFSLWLQLDFPNVGGVFPTYEIQVIKLINYVTARDLVRLGVEVRADCSCCKCHGWLDTSPCPCCGRFPS